MSDRNQSSVRRNANELGGRAAWLRSTFALRAWDIQWYRLADDLTGALIYLMVLFSPWAFGTTQAWSVWAMNFAGYALGLLLLFKLFIREAKGYRPPRWGGVPATAGDATDHYASPARSFTRALVWLTVAVLVYGLISVVNARSTYNPATRLFTYHHYLAWLPASLDAHRTWLVLAKYLALAGSFWALWDWLLGKTPAEDRITRAAAESAYRSPLPPFTARMRRLLWLLCVNGALLGLESIVQRVAGSNKLLFLVVPAIHKDAVAQFGPYAYRSNAAQYFNLLWPVCLGFWWTLQRAGSTRTKTHHLLLPCAGIMAACPIIATTRAGAIVSAGMLVIAIIYLAATNFMANVRRPNRPRSRWLTLTALIIFFAGVMGLGWYFGWEQLSPRMDELSEGYQYRAEMYAMARPMAHDYPWYGTGAGTFATVFQLYLISTETYWPEQLHNDWLETRITFGLVGFAIILTALACVILRGFAPSGIRVGRRFQVLAWLALAGCLVQAWVDYPFQVYSVLFLFLLICAVLFGLGQNSSPRSR